MGNNQTRLRTAKDVAKDGLSFINNGIVRNHKLGNTARIHTGEQEREEVRVFRDFLPSRIGCMVFELEGHEIYD